MLNISQRNLEKLSKQQLEIINSKERKIVVHAGPGSGKTYTMVKMITKELEEIDDYRGVIACSFTQEASSQLEKKVKEMSKNTEYSYIGTIDSLIINEIINPYKNRLLKSLGLVHDTKELTFSFPEYQSKASELTRQGIKEYNKTERENYEKKWIQGLESGNYEISFAAYTWATKLVQDSEIVSKYLSSKYTTVYIDEAQDMNEFQHKFFEIFVEKCNVKIVLIGDKNQSIYKFRGSRPEYFFDLTDKGYTEYKITESVRCHKSIIDFSNLLIDRSFIYDIHDDCRVYYNVSPTLENLNKTQGNYYILCESNSKALEVYNYLTSNGIDIILSKKLTIKDKNYSDNYLQLIEEIIRYRVNLDNKDPKQVVSVLDFKDILGNYQLYTKLKDNIIYDSSSSLIRYIEKIMTLIEIPLPDDVRDNLKKELLDEKVINQYKNFSNINRIMTIHASKGLEVDNVYVILNKVYKYDEEYKRKLFVAFTRAKNYLFISKSKESYYLTEPYESDFQDILTKINC